MEVNIASYSDQRFRWSRAPEETPVVVYFFFSVERTRHSLFHGGVLCSMEACFEGFQWSNVSIRFILDPNGK